MKLWLVISGANYGWSGRVREVYQHHSEIGALKRILWLVRYHISDENQTEFFENNFDLTDVAAVRSSIQEWESENYGGHSRNIHLLEIDTCAPDGFEYSPEQKNQAVFLGNLDLPDWTWNGEV